MKNYSGYKDGLNSKGMPSRTEDDDAPSTPRGKRRVERRAQGLTKPRHAHTWKMVDLYNNKRPSEALFRCECVNASRPVHRGGGRRSGCGATSRTGK